MSDLGTERKLVYVIDDELVIARTLAVILQRAGYRTEFFGSAEQALQAAAQRRPDLIVTDVVMDGMSGIELAETVAKAHPQLPVVLISGQVETSGLVRAARERGFHFHVHPKPIQPKQLLAEVDNMIADGHRKRAQELAA